MSIVLVDFGGNKSSIGAINEYKEYEKINLEPHVRQPSSEALAC